MDNYLVYKHLTTDGNIFYIGLSNNKTRPFHFHNRNNLWHKIYNKYGCVVEIIAENLTKEEACELEQSLIEKYGKRCDNSGCLANITSGGDGVKDYKFTEEVLQKLRDSHTGYVMPESQKNNISKALTGKEKQCSFNYSKPKNNLSDIRKKEISDKLKGSSPGKGVNKTFNKIKQLDPFTNEIINIFDNSVMASVVIKGDKSFASTIRKCCKGIQKISLGYKWEYL